MSALTWDELVLEGAMADRAADGARRHLRLVPPVEESGVTLTRRGRVVLALPALALTAVVAVVGVRMATAAPSFAPVAASTVTVAAGETLSEIAARELPGLPIREGVARIQILNNLSSTAISAGESLAIPKV